jgi:hypothetical protein
VFAGPLALQFWVIRVGIGLVAPLLLLVIPRTRTPRGLFVTSCLVFVGIFADRAIFVSAGQIVPGTAVGGVVSDPFAEYVPSLVELAIVAGAFGFFGLAYTLAERWLPMEEHFGHGVGGLLAGSLTGRPAVDLGVAWVADEEEVVVVGAKPATGHAHRGPAAPTPEAAPRPDVAPVPEPDVAPVPEPDVAPALVAAEAGPAVLDEPDAAAAEPVAAVPEPAQPPPAADPAAATTAPDEPAESPTASPGGAS